MLKKRISRSQKLAALPSDRPRVLYLMTMPHTDVEGRHEAKPEIVKGTIIPYIKNQTLKSIKTSLEQLHEVGLIILYENEGEKYLEVRRFEDFNTVNPSKEAKSHIPAPAPEQRQSNARVSPPEVKVKLKKDKEKYKDFD